MANPYLLLARIAAILLCIGGIYYAGYSREHTKLIEYRAQVAAEAKAQSEYAKQKDIENEKTTKVVSQAYAADIDKLNAYIGRMRQQYDQRSVPKVTVSNEGNDEPASEPSGACKGSQFYANALKDALMLQTWQEWAKAQHIPIN